MRCWADIQFLNFRLMRIKLENAAKLIREKLERIDFADKLNHLAVFKHFPRGCCKAAAIVYLYYFKKNKLVDPKTLFLLANAEIEQNRSHAWSKVGRFHVDFTGDQFGREKIVVTPDNPWPGIYRNPNKFLFINEKFNKEYERDLIRLLAFIG